MSDQSIFTKLSSPFHPDDLEWRPSAINSDKTKALALCYINARAVMDRLDEVVGPENWQDEYLPGPDGGVLCQLSLRINNEWITKSDGAENTDIEEIKGGLSSAFKRAAVKWGIGRYLYKLDGQWVPCEQRGKTVVLKNTPTLPEWALPQNIAPSKVAPISSIEISQGSPAKVEPMPAPVIVAAAVSSPKVNGGNQPHPIALPSNGKAQKAGSWPASLVKALLETDLAANAAEAVNMLNRSGLSITAMPADVIAWAKSQTKSEDGSYTPPF